MVCRSGHATGPANPLQASRAETISFPNIVPATLREPATSFNRAERENLSFTGIFEENPPQLQQPARASVSSPPTWAYTRLRWNTTRQRSAKSIQPIVPSAQIAKNKTKKRPNEPDNT